MRKVTTLFILAMLVLSTQAIAQETDYALQVEPSDDLAAPFTAGDHSGARDVSGPHDLDGDGAPEVLVSDYSAGGRVHVIEHVSGDTWEWVASTPVLDSTNTTNNIRAIAAGDLDADGFGEIYFLAGRNYSETNPDIDNLPPGLYAFEAQGDNDYGDAPAAVYQFANDLPDRWRAEQMVVMDVDGDGFDELMFANNGSDNRYDNWYVISVSGDLGSGFETFVEEVRLSSRGTEDFDPVSRGGGSPYGMIPADLDGDGTWEINMHSWNAYNFTNIVATGADTYAIQSEGDPNINIAASAPDDHVAFFGCVAVDIDQNGDDEIACPNLQTGDGTVINYESGENPLEITADNVALGILDGLSALGVGAGDLDGDGMMEIYGSGSSYTAGQFEAGEAPAFVNVAEYQGGDVEDAGSYVMSEMVFPEAMNANAFDTVIRDSIGTENDMTYLESGFQGPEFVSKFAYLGDVDGDGVNEMAIAFQGVDDSTYTYNEVWDPDANDGEGAYIRTVADVQPYDQRVFLRIVSGSNFAVANEDQIVVPGDYRLEGNYPNPFNPETTIRFALPIDKRISVKVYDMAGRLVKTLVNNELYTQGAHEVSWDGTNAAGVQAASGSYVYTLEYGNFRQSKTMVLLK